MADAEYPGTGLSLSVPHSSKLGMQFNYRRRSRGSCSRPVQSHKKISDGQGSGNSKKGFLEICENIGFEPP